MRPSWHIFPGMKCTTNYFCFTKCNSRNETAHIEPMRISVPLRTGRRDATLCKTVADIQIVKHKATAVKVLCQSVAASKVLTTKCCCGETSATKCPAAPVKLGHSDHPCESAALAKIIPTHSLAETEYNKQTPEKYETLQQVHY